MQKLFMLFIVLAVTLGLCAQDKPGLIVFGMANDLDDEEWRDARIGFGMQAIVSQAFYDTGEFSQLEEKQEIKDHIREISRKLWSGEMENTFANEDKKIPPEIEFFAYGCVYEFSTPSSSASFGVFHSTTTETVIKVEIVLQNRLTKKNIRMDGVGIAKTTANSAVFSLREDTVLFDETAAGKATREAVQDAVNRIMKKFDKIR